MAMCKKHEGEKPYKKFKLSLAEQKEWQTYQNAHAELVEAVAELRRLEVLVDNELAKPKELKEKEKLAIKLLDRHDKMKQEFYEAAEKEHGIEYEALHLHVSSSGKELIAFKK